MPIDIRGLAPLIQVFDMPVSLHFYRDVLGFTVASTSPALSENLDDVNWALLRHGQTELMLNTAYEPASRPPVPEPERFAGHRDTCLYFGCPDVDAAYRFLRDKGLDIREPKVAHYGMKQLYLNDPDGYCVCFQWTA